MRNPLDDQAVRIVITLPRSSEPLNKRPFLMALGIENQTPLFGEGTFMEIEEMARQLWWRFVPSTISQERMDTATSQGDSATSSREADSKAPANSALEPTLSLFD